MSIWGTVADKALDVAIDVGTGVLKDAATSLLAGDPASNSTSSSKDLMPRIQQGQTKSASIGQGGNTTVAARKQTKGFDNAFDPVISAQAWNDLFGELEDVN